MRRERSADTDGRLTMVMRIEARRAVAHVAAENEDLPSDGIQVAASLGPSSVRRTRGSLRERTGKPNTGRCQAHRGRTHYGLDYGRTKEGLEASNRGRGQGIPRHPQERRRPSDRGRL